MAGGAPPPDRGRPGGDGPRGRAGPAPRAAGPRGGAPRPRRRAPRARGLCGALPRRCRGDRRCLPSGPDRPGRPRRAAIRGGHSSLAGRFARRDGGRDDGRGPGEPAPGRARRRHRPLSTPGGDRPGRYGHRLPRRAAPAGPPPRGPEGHQAGDGHRSGRRPFRGRAPGSGPDGSPQHRQGPRRRLHRLRAPLLRHGAGRGQPHHPLLRRASSGDPRTAGTLRRRLPGGPARAPERGSSIATSSPRTSWSPSRTAGPRRR